MVFLKTVLTTVKKIRFRYWVELNCCKTKNTGGSTRKPKTSVLLYPLSTTRSTRSFSCLRISLAQGRPYIPLSTLSFRHITFICPTHLELIRPLKIYPRQVKMGAPQSKLQQPVENLYDALAPSNKTAEVDLLLAGLKPLLSRSIPRYSPSFSLALACGAALPHEPHNLVCS